MAARKKTSKVEGTARKPRARAAQTPETLIANVQQVWLAGMGAIAARRRKARRRSRMRWRKASTC